MRSLLALCLAVLPVASHAADLPAVSKDVIEAHALFLADDTLQGRNTGSEGYAIAANYAASQFRQYGLEPAGDGGTFFQNVPFIEQRLTGAIADVRAGGKTIELNHLDDYVIRPGTGEVREVKAPVVFVGFGIDAPDAGHRDYAGVDVKGKIVLMFTGAPAGFPTTERAHFSSNRLKSEEAAKRGAVGIIRLQTKIDKVRSPWERMLGFADTPSYHWISPEGRVHDAFESLVFTATLSSEGGRKLAEAAGASYETWLDQVEAVSYEPGPLPVELSVGTEAMRAKVGSPNVAAILRGADPKRSGETVVVTAHLDHVGPGGGFEPDRIHNGFYDNAMGSAIVLEMARVLSSAETRPARSILFLLVTAEEKGLLGSDYFAHHPTVPRESIVANVNVDMPLFLHPLSDVVAFGAEHSSLGALAEKAANANGFVLSPDPDPSEVIFVRSDQYSFVRQGIPAIYVDPGLGSAGGGDEGRNAVADFLKNHYHRPSDDSSRPVHWDSATRFTRMNAMMTFDIANAAEKPRWNKGDFFGVLFGGHGAR
jgi:hypothetical protein